MIKKIHDDLCALGVKRGDVLLIHASYRSMGNIEGGAKAFFDALLSYLGENGTLVMPALSFDDVTPESPYFSVKETPSCVGYMTEYFRTSVEGVLRSMNPTHSCCAKGFYAKELAADHEKDITPVGEHSPFAKLPRYGGKILFIGCSTDHNTMMHGVEEAAGLPFVLAPDPVDYLLEDESGNRYPHRAYPHYFKVDGRYLRAEYSRIEPMLANGEIRRGKLLEADCVLMDASAVWNKALNEMKRDPWAFIAGFVD